MCRKIIITDHYPNGQTAQSEEVDFCRSSGQMCSHPKIVNRHRDIVVDRLSPYQQSGLLNVRVSMPPTPPRSKTPSPSQRQSMYDDDFGTSKETKRRQSRPVVVMPSRPEPASPGRATTPPEYLVVEEPHRERHHHERDRDRGHHSRRRNSFNVHVGTAPSPLVDDLSTRHKARSPLVDAHLGSTPPRRRPSLSSSPTPTWPRSKRSSTTVDPRVIHQQWEAPARPSSSKRERGPTMVGLHDSEPSILSASTGTGPYMTPAIPSSRTRDRTSLPPRWTEFNHLNEQISLQNSKIEERQPRPPRPAPELKSILKKEKPRDSGGESLEELRRSISNLNIPSRSRDRDGRRSREREDQRSQERQRMRGRESQRSSQERDREHYRDDEDQTYWDRLKGRFGEDSPTRRRRHKVVYAGEDGTHRYY